ncbi:7727_t:CDS:2, partial [Diversispora eburnea]
MSFLPRLGSEICTISISPDQTLYAFLIGIPGTIQFYNAYTDRHVMEVEVLLRNLVSSSFEKEIIYHHVCHVAFSSNGEWMAT